MKKIFIGVAALLAVAAACGSAVGALAYYNAFDETRVLCQKLGGASPQRGWFQSVAKCDFPRKLMRQYVSIRGKVVPIIPLWDGWCRHYHGEMSFFESPENMTCYFRDNPRHKA